MTTKINSPRKVSVIIPTLNPSPRLETVLLELGKVHQLILSDGGSRGGRRSLPSWSRLTVIEAPRGRGSQLAAGAEAATGDWLLFLHDDTLLGTGWREEAGAFMDRVGDEYRAAAFTLRFNHRGMGAKRVAALANLRARLLGCPYGDQGLLISRRFYDHLGGYRPYPVMEDVDLVRRIGWRRITILKSAAITSSHKYKRDGWWRRPVKNLGLLALYFLGASPDWLARRYR